MSPSRRSGATRATAAEQLAHDLRHDVLTGALPPGQPLREEDLAAATGHSRHTVRTALALLVAGRLAVAAALVAALALALFVLRIVVSAALLVLSAVFWLLALWLGYLWLTRRNADRDAARR